MLTVLTMSDMEDTDMEDTEDTDMGDTEYTDVEDVAVQDDGRLVTGEMYCDWNNNLGGERADMSQPTHEKHGQVVDNPSPQATQLKHVHHAPPAEEPLPPEPRRTSRERRLPRNLQDYYLGNIDDSEHDSNSDDGDLEISEIVKFDTTIDIDDEEISSAPGLSSAVALDILPPPSILPSLDNLEAPVTAGVESGHLEVCTAQIKLSKGGVP